MAGHAPSHGGWHAPSAKSGGGWDVPPEVKGTFGAIVGIFSLAVSLLVDRVLSHGK